MNASSELKEAQQAYDAAEANYRAHPNPADPQTPEEWMTFSRYLDARDELRTARKRLDAVIAGSKTCES